MTIGTNKTIRVKGVVNGNDVELDVHFTVSESGAFDYGNKTATFVEYLIPGQEEPHEDYFDTRYFHGDVNDFAKYYVQNCLNKTFEIIGGLE